MDDIQAWSAPFETVITHTPVSIPVPWTAARADCCQVPEDSSFARSLAATDNII